MSHNPAITKLVLLGGRSCLDFINTLAERNTTPHEWLCSYDDFVVWSVHAGTISQPEAEHLLTVASTDTTAGAQLDSVVQFRESLYEILRAAIDQRAPVPEQVVFFNHILSESLSHLSVTELSTDYPTYGYDWQGKADLAYPLWPLARSAADLITSPDLERVHQCPGCNWLFLDQSRNRSRTWCGMQWCGNRAKARRHYERRVAGTREPRGSANFYV